MGRRACPEGGHGNLFQYSCLENAHGQKSLEGYSPWGHKELDMTGRLSAHTHIHIHPHPANRSDYLARLVLKIKTLHTHTHTHIYKIALLGEFHGQRSLEGYRPGGHKESDTTELRTHTHTHIYTPTHTMV